MMKFLREHAELLNQQRPQLAVGEVEVDESTWLVVECSDRQGLLADIASTISFHSHNIKVWAGW